MTTPLVSVIIPTKNEAARLPALIASIRAQTYPAIEILVVDNFSTDASATIIPPLVDLYCSQGPERSTQRNHGAQRATGQYLLFLDADMQLSPTVIEECVSTANERDRIAIIIPEQSFGIGYWAQCKILERECYVGDDAVEAPRFFAASTFREVGGYCESMIGFEDWDLTRRVRTAHIPVERISARIMHDEGKLSLWHSMRKKMYYAQDFIQLSRRNGLSLSAVAPVRSSFLRHWRKFLAEPHLGLGVIVMKSCEVTAGAFGMLRGLKKS